MIAGIYALVPIAGLDGAAAATLCGFGGYCVVIALTAKVWPDNFDIFVGLLGSCALVGGYQWAIDRFDIFGGLLAVALICPLYGILTARGLSRRLLNQN